VEVGRGGVLGIGAHEPGTHRILAEWQARLSTMAAMAAFDAESRSVGSNTEQRDARAAAPRDPR